MPLEPISASALLGSAGITAAGGIAGAIGSAFNNERNIEAQREAQQWNQTNIDNTRMREDNAVQRRVADLKAAGLSPVLAAGSAASSSSPIKIDAIHSEDSTGLKGLSEGMVTAMNMQNQYATTMSNLQTAKAQRDLLKAQEVNKKADTVLKGIDARYYGTAGHWPRNSDGLWNFMSKYAPELLKKFDDSPGLPDTPEGERKRLDANRPSGIPQVTEAQIRYLMERMKKGG